jgi:mRNA-degrading endonuclease RelE of RelBE toxin-antitoxin system
MQDRIRKKLGELQKDPFTTRAKADIKLLHGTKPLKYRYRIGKYRIIYLVHEKEVRIIELIKRKKGYGMVD